MLEAQKELRPLPCLGHVSCAHLHSEAAALGLQKARGGLLPRPVRQPAELGAVLKLPLADLGSQLRVFLWACGLMVHVRATTAAVGEEVGALPLPWEGRPKQGPGNVQGPCWRRHPVDARSSGVTWRSSWRGPRVPRW